ncbi:hypothetical protein [Enterococcus faecalis]|uniref:hypothetical protein n=1 Tax=Enterococcus faecalis TaxID=1351 RepID=UPI000DE9D6CC|nr:hypothetical protein [Enterococcus faecalis]EHP0971885.1 hypothetical protein [Enterococcus faecalis]MCD4912549.1 hypothetical protein [Enterococcus faecalis]RBR61873.1 hypothetical protein EB38_02687 [Enterococcus faecalis]RXN39684.1 hypothetical protein CYQ41_15660 [Enterococcus faecalis]RXU94663.1 hypothetical protein CYQ46_13595 [Enterococcus faecalis]
MLSVYGYLVKNNKQCYKKLEQVGVEKIFCEKYGDRRELRKLISIVNQEYQILTTNLNQLTRNIIELDLLLNLRK